MDHPDTTCVERNFQECITVPSAPAMYQATTCRVESFCQIRSGRPSPLRSRAATSVQPDGRPGTMVQSIIVLPCVPPRNQTSGWRFDVFCHIRSIAPSSLKSVLGVRSTVTVAGSEFTVAHRMFFVVSIRCVSARPASSNTRIRPSAVASTASYAMPTVRGPEYVAVVDTRNSQGFHERPNVVERLLLMASTVVIPAFVTLENVTRTSRIGRTCTFVPIAVVTPSGDPSSGGSGTPNGFVGPPPVGVPGVTVSVTGMLSGHIRSRPSAANVIPLLYVPTARLPVVMVTVA